MTHSTQYAIVYKGRVDLSMVFATRADVDGYLRTAVSHGHDAADYGIAHRRVTYGDWAPTTSRHAEQPANQPANQGGACPVEHQSLYFAEHVEAHLSDDGSLGDLARQLAGRVGHRPAPATSAAYARD